MDMERFRSKPVMGILRGVGAHAIEPLTRAVISAGLETMEITMNTEGAPELIKKAVKVSGGRLSIGAGTVLDMKSLKDALGKPATTINLFIGPEGGFSVGEVDRARAAGARTVTLGPLILRTETAGFMAAAALLYEFGVVQ